VHLGEIFPHFTLSGLHPQWIAIHLHNQRVFGVCRDRQNDSTGNLFLKSLWLYLSTLRVLGYEYQDNFTAFNTLQL